MPGKESLSLRRARFEDIPSIEIIERESFPDPWKKETFLEALAYYPSTCFVAEDDGRIAGFIAAGIENTGVELYGHIMNLAVSPEYRHRGIGSMLVQQVEQACMLEGTTAVSLEVRETNVGARAFYHRIGYRQVLRIAEYYADGDTAAVMMKWHRM
jgi:ribosomal-protein-alanine N-acetyltransferase